MKITFVEEIEARAAFTHRMCCHACGSRHYKIHHQLEPKDFCAWWVECADCGEEAPDAPSRELAIARWKQLC